MFSFLSFRYKSILIIALTMTIGISCTALAADLEMPTKSHMTPTPALQTWTFRLTPYIWATSLNGSTTVKGRTTDVDASFIDILEHTEFPKNLFEAAAFGEARNGRLALLADLLYVKIGLNKDLTHAHTVDEANASVGLSAGLKIRMAIAELAAAYEIADWNGLSSSTSRTALDFYAGARAWWQHADAQFAISGTVNTADLTLTGNRVLSAEGSVSWVDPVIGARIRHRFSPAWNLAVSGDVGGFGTGSKFSWQALAAMDYEFAKTQNVSWSGMVGYKALFVDYSQGSGLTHYEYDMTMHGPILGVTARF